MIGSVFLKLFRQTRTEYSDGIVDLHPVRPAPSHPMLCFNRVYEWIITLHGCQHEIGRICFRDSEGRGVYYFGHIGYHIDERYRGHAYSMYACRLILPAICLSGRSSAVITCDSDNAASIMICRRLGCLEERSVDVPEDIVRIFETGALKQRFILEVSPEWR